jgi:hypothetical protein
MHPRSTRKTYSHAVVWHMRCCVLTGLLLLSGSCLGVPDDEIGDTLRELSRQETASGGTSDSILYVVVNPSQCTVCNNEIERVRTWAAAAKTGRYRLVLSREPNRSERAALIRYRLIADTVLAMPDLTRDGPVVAMMVQSMQVFRAVGQQEIRALFTDSILGTRQLH